MALRRIQEKIWATVDTALLLAEWCGLLAREGEFIRVMLMAFTDNPTK